MDANTTISVATLIAVLVGVAWVIRVRSRARDATLREDGPVVLSLGGLGVAAWVTCAGPFATQPLALPFALVGLLGLIWWGGRVLAGSLSMRA